MNKKVKDNVSPVDKKVETKINELLAAIRKLYDLVITGLDKNDIKFEQIDHEIAKLQSKK